MTQLDIIRSRMTTDANRISIEHEIPLDVAKAMLRDTVIMVLCAMDAEANEHLAKAQTIKENYADVWLLLAEPLGIKAKVESIIEDCLDAAQGHIHLLVEGARAHQNPSNTPSS